jgi:hypothetical protein
VISAKLSSILNALLPIWIKLPTVLEAAGLPLFADLDETLGSGGSGVAARLTDVIPSCFR